MQNSRKFFSNRECEYFPCHDQPSPDDFNCMFCFCPLYALGDECGGDFVYNERGYKSCIGCHLPHLPEYYDVIIEKLRKR